jgi:hypothetical protein
MAEMLSDISPEGMAITRVPFSVFNGVSGGAPEAGRRAGHVRTLLPGS